METDLSNDSTSLILEWIPDGIWWTLGLCLGWLILGWLLACRGVRRSPKADDLEIFILFPITHFFFLPIFVWKDWKSARPGLVCYLFLLFTWIAGNYGTEQSERIRLKQYEAALSAKGESLSPESKHRVFDVTDTSNIWTHPFLLPLAEASMSNHSSEVDPSTIAYSEFNTSYDHVPGLRYDTSIRESTDPGLLRLHESATSILYTKTQSFSFDDVPKNWPKIASIVIRWFDRHSSAFESLREALDRPKDDFPIPWKEGSQMWLPELSIWKKTTQALRLRGVAHAARGDADKSHDDIMTCIRLAQVGHADILISRLVQIAQTTIALQAIETAQQFHLWNDEQWRQLDAALKSWDFPAYLPDGLRSERIMTGTMLRPLFDQPTSDILYGLDKQSISIPGIKDWSLPPEWPLYAHVPVNTLTSGFARALLMRQWRLYLKHIDVQVAAAEAGKHLELLDRNSSSNLSPTETRKSSLKNGIFSVAWLSSIHKFQDKLLRIQSMIRMTRIAIALERWCLRTGSYPETLSPLKQADPGLELSEAGKGHPMEYRYYSNRSFSLSFQHGLTGNRFSASNPNFWHISSTYTNVPGFFDPNKQRFKGNPQNAPTMDLEMMKRYGLIPMQTNPAKTE